jgi:hypothetical protein
VLDAAALSLWAPAGAQKTLAAGLGWLPTSLDFRPRRVFGKAAGQGCNGMVPQDGERSTS